MVQPIRVYLMPSGPNPWKVILVLEELNIPYEIREVQFANLKQKPFTDINPNGRVPAIQDPNTGLVLWESGAIIQYIIEQYDTQYLLSYPTFKEKHQLNQWLFFQTSGQGPYFGQAAWFNVLHSEKLPSAISRYQNEVKRVLGVLEGALEGREWLVGDKMTFADLSFSTWNDNIDSLLSCSVEERFDGFPNVKAWHDRITERPAWKRNMQKRAELMDEHSLRRVGLPEGVNSMEEYQAYLKEHPRDDM